MTLAEAKDKLKEAAGRASPTAWVRENPGEAVAYAFFAGFASGTSEKKLVPMVGLVSRILSYAASHGKNDHSEPSSCR